VVPGIEVEPPESKPSKQPTKKYSSAMKHGLSNYVSALCDWGRDVWSVMGQRVWRYHSFDPLPEDALDKKSSGRRLRSVTLPDGMKRWNIPGFDDSSWKSGRGPVGTGVYTAHFHGQGHSDYHLENNSDWGSGELLLMRSTFDVQDLDYEYFSLSILCKDGYTVYLNGRKLRTYIWFQSAPHYDQLLLSDEIRSHLKKGANTLAIYCNVVYDKKDKGFVPVGQIDAYIEGVKKEDLGSCLTTEMSRNEGK
jgi:hypothetical protein